MKILIAGMSVRAMVESAVRSRYPVIALDAYGDQDLRQMAESISLHHDFHVRYSPRELEKAARQLEFESVAYTSNLENYPDTLRRIAGRRTIIGNQPDTIQSVRSWMELFPRLARAGFFVPETMSANATRGRDLDRRWLVKPLLSGGGHGIDFWLSSKSPPESVMLQEFIPGKPCSASFIADGHECIVVGVTEQLVGMEQFGSKGFHYCGNILPLPECLHPSKGRAILEQVRQLAAFLTREYGLTGVNGIDFILNGAGVFLTEVNPRYSASMELIERAYGLPMFKAHVQAVTDGTLPDFSLEAELKKGKFFGKAILFAGRDAVAPDTRGWMGKAIRDIPLPGERIHAGNPVCTILANRRTCEETLSDLIGTAASLKESIHGIMESNA